MHSVSDLTTSSRKTSGNVPPKLVGASTTIVGDKMYLFGGRLVAERRMVSDLYVFDLETFVWTKVMPHSGEDVPGARYFHSADSWSNFLIIFGGMGHKPEGSSTDDLVVLNDIRFFDIQTFRWLPPDSSPSRALDGPSASPSTADPIDPVAAGSSSLRAGADFTPRARYAHLSAVSGASLYVMGGQDLQNAWLDDVCVYDLRARRWAVRRDYPRHAGTYRSVAVAAQQRVRDPAREAETRTAISSEEKPGASLGTPGSRFNNDKRFRSPKGEYTPSETLVHLPYSTDPTDDFPNDIFLYSNYNFTDVKRELEVFTPQSGGDDFTMSDRSASMTGAVLPPGLRFPSGAICGSHLIFAGTYLAHSYQSYSIWALDLVTMTWTRLDPGAALATGSWFRAALWNSQSRQTCSLLIFGNRSGSLVEDYNRRLLAWDDVAVLDLEAFGIYQPPRLQLDLKGQELGLGALEEGLMADFEVVCDDGRRIPCSRRLLEVRWPWFREQRRIFREQATRALGSALEQAGGEAAASDPPIPDDLLNPPVPLAVGAQPDPRPDPRLTPRALLLSEPYAVTLALLQYLYAQALLTPLQHAPAVLSQLLLLSATYNLPHLQALVRHAMHRALAPTTSVGVYEVATLCGCQSLQIRALKAVMASSRRNTGGRARGNSTAGGGAGGSAGPSRGTTGSSAADRDHDGGGGGSNVNSARARGVSDVRGNMSYGSPNDSSGFSGEAYGPNGTLVMRSRLSVHFADGGGRSTESHKLAAAAPTPDPDPEASSAVHVKFDSYGPRPSHLARGLSMDTIYMALNEADEDTDYVASASALASESERGHDREMDFPESCANSINQRLSTLSISPTASPALVYRHANAQRLEGFVADDLFDARADIRVGGDFGPLSFNGRRRRGSETQSGQSSVSTSNSSLAISQMRRRAYSALADLATTSPSTGSASAETDSSNASGSEATSGASANLLVGSKIGHRRSAALMTGGEEAGVARATQIAPAAAPAGPRTPTSMSIRQRVRAVPQAIIVSGAGTTSASDSDCPSLSSSLSSGLNIPSGISIKRPPQPHSHSPLTPDSPPLATPADVNASFAALGLGTLSAIDESSAYEGSESEREAEPHMRRGLGAGLDAERNMDSLMGLVPSPTRMSFAPAFSRAGAGLRARFGKSASGNTKFVEPARDDNSMNVIDISTPGPSDADAMHEWNIVSIPASSSLGLPATPVSPALSSLAPSVISYTGDSSADYGRDEDPASENEDGRGTPRASGRTQRTSNDNGSFFSRSRILRKKRASDAPTLSPRSAAFVDVGGLSPPGTPSSAKWPPMSIVPYGPADLAPLNAKKAAKAEEKRRRKEEEKRRLEALAAQFAARRAKGKDGVSEVSSGSSETKRRIANDWLEESGGMYSASGVDGWAGL